MFHSTKKKERDFTGSRIGQCWNILNMLMQKVPACTSVRLCEERKQKICW